MQPCRRPKRRRSIHPEEFDGSEEHSLDAENPTKGHVGTDPLEQIKFIRATLESAGSFTAVPGLGQVAIGFTALAATYFAARESAVPSFPWLRIWLVEAVFAIAIGSIAIAHKLERAGQSPLSGPARKFAVSFVPPLMVGALLTFIMFRAGDGAMAAIPGMWMLLYGTAVITGGAFSVRSVPAMGLVFVALGVVALFTPNSWTNAYMALAFGGVHIIFGSIIARKYGG